MTKNNETLKSLIENSNIPAGLIRATVSQFGGFESFKECAPDVNNHGIGGGFHGFIYYTDTVKFFRNQRVNIIEMAKSQAEDFGVGMLEMIAGFGCMKSLDISEDEIARAMYTGKGEMSEQIMNCLAWYAGEEVARAYCDMVEA
ncbi:MAG TPA: hypothetical protein DCS09_11140 [Porphyromonadaceae bacterium]|nr:hypothetical protein [Porphyromonadaceae bacterium]